MYILIQLKEATDYYTNLYLTSLGDYAVFKDFTVKMCLFMQQKKETNLFFDLVYSLI